MTTFRSHFDNGEYICYKRALSSVQFSRSVVSNSLWPHESQHTRPPCPSPSPRVHSNSRPSSQWCHPDNSSSVIPFFSCPQSLPASECFPMSQLFGPNVTQYLLHEWWNEWNSESTFTLLYSPISLLCELTHPTLAMWSLNHWSTRKLPGSTFL